MMPVKRAATAEVEAVEPQDVSSDGDEVTDGAAVDAAGDGNKGWADVMSRLLSAPAPKKRYVILAKARKADHTEKLSEDEAEKPVKDPGFVVDGEEEQQVPEKKSSKSASRTRALKRKEDLEKRKKHREWEMMGRLKPDVLDKDRERTLCKIATRGVVQLFNAVRKQQIETNAKLKEAGGSLRKEEQALKAVSKEAFMERLRAGGADGDDDATEGSSGGGGDSTWSVLREDYMPEAGLKDWDRESEEEAEESGSAGESDDSG